jgi:hypothetical protein
MAELSDELDMLDPMLMAPTQFIAAVKEALEEEAVTQRFAIAHTKLFEAVMPLTGVAQQAAELRKREAFLKRQINAMKDELDFRKKLDADGNVLPKGVLEIFTGADGTAVDSDSSEDFEGYDDDDDDDGGDGDDDGVVGGEDSEDEDATKQRVAPSLLRKELLDSGVPATVLSLDLGALPKSLSVARLVNEIVCVPYHGQPCFLFAVRPAKDGDVSDVVRVLMRLSKHCSDNASIYRFWARPTTMATCWLRSNTRAGPPWRGWRARLRTATSQCRRRSRSRWPSTWPAA